MKRSSVFAVLVAVLMLAPAAVVPGDRPAGALPRSDPGIQALDAHSSEAEWDFASPAPYNATDVDIAPAKVNLSMTTRPGDYCWSQLANLGADGRREDFSAAYDPADGMLIIHGGRYHTLGMQDTDWFRPLYTYDPVSDAWTDRGTSKLPAGNVGVWDGPDGAFLTHGGYYTYFDPGQGVNVYVVENSTFAWLPATPGWRQLADGPELYHHAAVYDPVDGVMITFGGMYTLQTGNGTRDYYYNNLYVYNYTTDTWREYFQLNPPPARAYHSAVWDDESNQMIVFGGFNGQSALSDCWAFNYSNGLWTQFASASASRYMHAAAWDSGKAEMTVVGGRTGVINSNETLLLDPSANSWSSGTRLPANPRILLAAAFDGNATLVCGGGDGTGSDQFQDAWALSQGDPVQEYLPSGSIQSPVLDLGPAFHSVDRIFWDGDMPVGTGVSLRFRADNLDIEGSAFAETANGSKPTRQGRYIQWNLSLQSSTDRQLSPKIWRVKVEYTLNNRPEASASAQASAFKRTVVLLNGSATDDDGDELTYRWTKLSGPPVTIVSADSAVASFSPEHTGTYTFTLVASDPFADSPAASVSVSVLNRAPRAEAGPDVSGVRMELVQISGRGIDDDGDPLTYEWSQVAGPTVNITQPTTRNLTFVPERLGNYTFRLVVDDGEETSAPALANATILGQAPAAKLGVSPVQTHINDSVNFTSAASSDPDGRVVQRLFDFGDGTNSGWMMDDSVSHRYSRPGMFNATLTVKDDDGYVSEPSSPVRITVRNRPPVVEASVTPESGSVSTQFRFLVPKGSTYDPDGTIVAYFWDFGDGTNSTAMAPTHVYGTKGDYEVLFRVTDEWGATAELYLDVRVVNRAPAFSAAAPASNITMNTGLEQLFSADASDPDGDDLSYTWTVNGALQAENTSRFFFKPERAGTYHIVLEVSDGEMTARQEWDVTARKKPVPVEETDGLAYALPALAIVIIAAALGALFVARRSRPKEEAVVVYAPPGYKPGDDLLAPSGLVPTPPGAATPVADRGTPSPAAPPVDSAEPVATAVAVAPSMEGPAPMEAIPFAEPVAPSEGGAAMEALPLSEDTAQAEPAPPQQSSRAEAEHMRPPASYRPPPKSGLSPQEPYAKQMWRK